MPIDHHTTQPTQPTSCPQPLVSIGLPVYNGAEHLERALCSLLAQDYPRLEIIISDNASTDATPDIARRFAEQYTQISYVRHEENVGALANFISVLKHVRGQYFMWAAHDDTWSPQYVSTLAAQLEANPQAVLATAPLVYVNPDGSLTDHSRDREAPGTSAVDNLWTFVEDDACGWIYGVYRADWLRRHVHELNDYPDWRADLIWLFDVILRHPVVGSNAVTLYKSVIDGRYRQTQRERLIGWLRICRELARISFRSARGRTRWAACQCAWYYCYRKYLRRGNPIGTTVRILKVLAMAVYFGLSGLAVRRQAKA